MISKKIFEWATYVSSTENTYVHVLSVVYRLQSKRTTAVKEFVTYCSRFHLLQYVTLIFVLKYLLPLVKLKIKSDEYNRKINYANQLNHWEMSVVMLM